MLILTRFKGQSVFIDIDGYRLWLKYLKSGTGAAILEVTGDLKAFSYKGFIDFHQNPPQACVTQTSALSIIRKDLTLRVVVNYIKPERASIGFDGPKAFIITRGEFYDSVSQA